MAKRTLTEEQKQVLRDRIANARLSRTRPAPKLAAPEEPAARERPAEEQDVSLADYERQAIADGILTLEDILQVRVEAKQKVMLEQRASAKKALADKAVERERHAAGLIPADTEHKKWLEGIVSYTVRLPKQGPRDVPEHRVDGRVFTNGRSYQVTRAQYMSLIDTEQRAWHHQSQIQGMSKTYYDELLGQMVYQGGVARGSGSMA